MTGAHWVWEIMTMLQRGVADYHHMPKEMAFLEFLTPSCIEEIHAGEPTVINTHLPLWAIPNNYYAGVKTGECCKMLANRE